MASSKLFSNSFEEGLDTARALFDLTSCHTVRPRSLASLVEREPSPGIGQRSTIAHQIEHVSELSVRVRVTPPVQFALHVEDKLSIHRAGHESSSCWHSVPTVPLRHVRGFPALGLLRGLRLSLLRSPVASVIFQIEEEADPRFLGSIADLSSVLETDFIPCGIRPTTTTDVVES
jgi:hypothetical protein